jgi:lysophospholipase L1-like esterase
MAAGLTAWHLWVDHAGGLAPEIFKEAFQLRWPHPPAPPVPQRSIAKTGAAALQPAPNFVDDGDELDPFFASLWKLEQGEPGLVTVLHYGDSPTTADMITGDIRLQLQKKFGDAGRGYTLISKPWPWYGHRGVEMSGHGWKWRFGIGSMREGVYGLGGVAFSGEPGAWSKFRFTEGDQSALEVEYLARPGGGSFVVEADGSQLGQQSTEAPEEAATRWRLALPAGTKEVAIRPVIGDVTLFGVDFRRGLGGLLYDSLGLNGATTTVLGRTQPTEIWKQELALAKPNLIVVNYGSNESSFGNFVHKQYAAELKLAISRIRALSPGTSILIMSPMDRGERRGLDDIETMSTIPEIVQIQRQVAAETHCAFFDTYAAMGGNGTVARWYAASPRLITADLLHPTPQGATIVAGLFLEQLASRYNRWKVRHGIALPAPVAKVAAPAKPTQPARTANKHHARKAAAK